ncbi:TetR/AcrR family transcriptional regulator [Dactylosporangium sp. NPDC005555]|uniref:TetR/AcrR family transcriptional regulator n=1 Tax=Dactylosporangium sp. NPDC005555 TaxID=3154889 RepID=UPI0033BA11F7
MTAVRRRYGTELVRALQDAVLAEVAERGYAATTYDTVALRAGTSKPVLYRRWSSKAEMVADALVTVHAADVLPPDTGSLAGDLKVLLAAVRRAVTRSGRRTLIGLLAEPGPAIGAAVRRLLFADGAATVLPLVERARRRGELGSAPLPAEVVVLPLDLARHAIVVDGGLTDEALAAIVDQVVVPLLKMHSER